MKFHESAVARNLESFPKVFTNGKFRFTRDNNDMLQMWKVVSYFQPKSFLEIGFLAGQTFGIFLDAVTDSNTKYVAVDLTFQFHRYIIDTVFGNHPKLKTIKFIETDSRKLELTDKFDFIHIDGDHTYPLVLNDFLKCLPLMHDKTILAMDDTLDTGVDQVIQEHLLGQHGFVPFLAGNKQIFFCHQTAVPHDFLKNELRKGIEDFVVFDHWNYQGFDIVKMHTPNFIEENQAVFNLAIHQYDI